MSYSVRLVFSFALCLGLLPSVARSGDEFSTPGQVAVRFVEALADRYYGDVVECIDPNWIYDDLEARCKEHENLRRGERDAFAKEYGAPSFAGLCEESMESYSTAWARKQWPRIFPPELVSKIDPVEGFVGTLWYPPSHMVEDVWVTIVQEVVDSRRCAYVTLEVWEGRRCLTTGFEFLLNRDGRGQWWIVRIVDRGPLD